MQPESRKVDLFPLAMNEVAVCRHMATAVRVKYLVACSKVINCARNNQ